MKIEVEMLKLEIEKRKLQRELAKEKLLYREQYDNIYCEICDRLYRVKKGISCVSSTAEEIMSLVYVRETLDGR